MRRRVSRPSRSSAQHRINDRIRVPRVRLIDSEGNQVGVIDTRDALARAQEEELDLVEVAPMANPPVCRIMDYGKYRYKQQKKKQAAKSSSSKVKEVRMRPTTDDHDVQVKLGHAKRFLEKGDKVLCSMLFRGREMAHKELGENLMLLFAEQLGTVCDVEQHPRMDGRKMTMMLAPK